MTINGKWKRQFLGLLEASLDFDFEGCHLSKTWLLDCDLPLNQILCNYIFNDMSLPCNLSPQKRKA